MSNAACSLQYIANAPLINNPARKLCVIELRVSAIRACSYDPAYRDVSLTDDLASYLFSYKILHCVHMRKRAGPLAEISFEFAEIIGRRDENFSIII